MTKIFCDLCKEKEIENQPQAALWFSFITQATQDRDCLNIQDKQLLLCEECKDRVISKLLEFSLLDE